MILARAVESPGATATSSPSTMSAGGGAGELVGMLGPNGAGKSTLVTWSAASGGPTPGWCAVRRRPARPGRARCSA